MKVTITQLDGYQPPALADATAFLPAIVTPGSAAKVTFNAAGLITGTLPLALADVQAALGFIPYDGAANLAGFITEAGVPRTLSAFVNDVGYSTSGGGGGSPETPLASATTPDGVPLPLGGLPQLPASQSVGRVVWRVTAQDVASGDAAIFDAVAGIKRVSPGGAVTFVGVPEVSLYAADASMAACTAAFSAGAALALSITGIAGRTIAWTVKEVNAL